MTKNYSKKPKKVNYSKALKTKIPFPSNFQVHIVKKFSKDPRTSLTVPLSLQNFQSIVPCLVPHSACASEYSRTLVLQMVSLEDVDNGWIWRIPMPRRRLILGGNCFIHQVEIDRIENMKALFWRR